MKVIGVIPLPYSNTDSVIVEMTSKELEQICGSSFNDTPRVGTVFKVHEIYSRMRGLKDNQERLKNVRQQLIAVAGLLEPLEGVVSCDAPAEEKGDAEQTGQS